LEAMFSGRHELKIDDGAFFIDRSPESFVSILNFLRTGKMIMPDSKRDREMLEEEIVYFGLEQGSFSFEIL